MTGVRRARVAAVLTVVAALGVPLAFADVDPAGASDRTPPDDRPLTPVGPDLELRGEAAVRRLAMDAIFRTSALDPHTTMDAIDVVAEDDLAFVDVAGNVGYSEPAVATAPPHEAPIVHASLTEDDAFSLHSNPSSPLTVLLDFDGHTTSGTFWNSTYTGGASIVSAPYSTDADQAFSANELANIAATFDYVAEDYAGFDVDVTTEDPGEAAMRKSGSGDTEWGIRVVISPTDWYEASTGHNAGGVAYLHSFTWSSDTPAWVFSSNLANGSPTAVAEAASHEAGHAFGLHHDGKSSASYYSGHGDWAPIMGVGYYKPVTQWNDGDYSGATNAEDDLAIIASNTGYVSDDHGDTVGAATTWPLPISADGLLAPNEAGDVFVFTVPSDGYVDVEARPTSDRNNLVASVRVLGVSGGVIDEASSPTASAWTISSSTPVPAGTYAVQVVPAGMAGGDGFSSYGSHGRYHIDVDHVPGPIPPSTDGDPPPDDTEPPSTDDPDEPAEPADVATVSPARLADTRPGFDTVDGLLAGVGRLPAGATLAVPVGARAAVPGDAAGVALNVAAVSPSDSGFVTVYPCDEPRPNASTLNYRAGTTIANATVTKLAADGTVCVFTRSATDLVIDLNAFVPSGSDVRLASPARLADTRPGGSTVDGLAVGTGVVAGGTTLRVPVAGRGGLDENPGGVLLNVVAVDPSGQGFLTVYPCDQPRPTASNLNYQANVTIGNFVVTPVSDDVCIFARTATHLVVDVSAALDGAASSFAPMTPKRLADTRPGSMTHDGLVQGVGAPGAGRVRRVPIASRAGIPDDAAGVVLNVAAVAPAGFGFVTAYPCDEARPNAANLNVRPGVTQSNAATVKLAADGSVCIYTHTMTDLVVDVTGIITD